MDKIALVDRIGLLRSNTIDFMQVKAFNILNPNRYHLSREATKRIKWMYIIHYECSENISKAAKKIGVSRQWLSTLHSRWEKGSRDPRSLEPQSKAPLHTDNRNRIPQKTEDKIIAVREKYPAWGKEKISAYLLHQQKILVSPSSVNRYLVKHKLISPKISMKNKIAFKNTTIKQKQKLRPPKEIKDFKPGALIEKDMKYVLKPAKYIDYSKPKLQGNFYYQHTESDSFTRIRTLELVTTSDSKGSLEAHKKSVRRFPFPVACYNTDNGGENGKDFFAHLEENKFIHFFSRVGTPTDNPRVERSHLTDEIEFYQQGNFGREYDDLKARMKKWERVYNYERPHQALGNLTPMQFYKIWKQDPEKAYQIKDKWQAFLKKQRERQYKSRRMKNKEEIEKLMQFINLKVTTPTCQ